MASSTNTTSHWQERWPVSRFLKDIANKSISWNTVQGYIDRAHNACMKAMFYNLCYGAPF